MYLALVTQSSDPNTNALGMTEQGMSNLPLTNLIVGRDYGLESGLDAKAKEESIGICYAGSALTLFDMNVTFILIPKNVTEILFVGLLCVGRHTFRSMKTSEYTIS
ncbi:hypothetical protein ACJX0J_008808, partial [Zea mays]